MREANEQQRIGYVAAIGATGVAFAIRLALDPLLGEHIPYATFFVAVVVTA